MTERDRRISDQLVRLVQIVFGLVLAQSFLLYRDVVVHPLASGHWVAALALGTVYITTVLSWIDWHVTMEARPYNFNPRNRYRLTEQFRLGLDVLVVTVYAYLLFAIQEFVGAPHGWMGGYLLGFPAVFAAYLISGLARRRAHGKLATNPAPILCFGLWYVLLYLGYAQVYNVYSPALKQAFKWVNGFTVVLALGIMLAYRVTRRKLAKRRAEDKDAGLVIGIDVDGVLANQIHGIQPRVRARLGMELRYEDITDWRLPLGNSDIAKEIGIALEDPEYVVGMPVHDGAREVVDGLYTRNRIVMITGRPPETRAWTSQWLQNHGFTLDDVVNIKERNKSFYRTDVLVDDYIENIREYLMNTNGTAILVDQPWNRRDRRELDEWVRTERLHVVETIREVPAIIAELRARRRQETGVRPDVN